MTSYQPGEIVDITIRGAQVVEHYDQGDPPTVVVTAQDNTYELYVNFPWTGVEVARVAPPEWPPRSGDLWRNANGTLYFAVRYTPDYDRKADCEGIDSSGTRVVLVSQYEDDSSLGAACFRPDHVNRRYGPLSLIQRVHRKPAFDPERLECGLVDAEAAAETATGGEQ